LVSNSTSVALREPVSDGAKRRSTEQLAPTATWAPQVEEVTD
jgi:hypothetical protein